MDPKTLIQKKTLFMGATVLLTLCLLGLQSLKAEGPKDMGGWELDGAYNKLYNVNDFDEFKCQVVKIIDITPLPGMSPGVGMVVKDLDDEEVTVHIGPRWFINPKSLGLRKGTKLKLKGAWAQIKGKEVFMASKYKILSNEQEFKVRLTSNGKPFWTMTPGELAKERADQ